MFVDSPCLIEHMDGSLRCTYFTLHAGKNLTHGAETANQVPKLPGLCTGHTLQGDTQRFQPQSWQNLKSSKKLVWRIDINSSWWVFFVPPHLKNMLLQNGNHETPGIGVLKICGATRWASSNYKLGIITPING